MSVQRRLLIAAVSLTMLGTRHVIARQAAAPAPAPQAVPATPAQAAPQATAPAPKKGERPAIYDEKADAKQRIDAALARAKKENRRVLVQWGANWCGWCRLLHETCAANADLKKELQYEYDVVLIDIGRFDRNMELAAALGADLKGNGVPYLTVLDASGEAIANQETSSLEEGDHHDPAKVLAFLKRHEAEHPAAESVLSEGMKRAAAENKAVFLHFGAPWCVWCHRLEDWMARPEVSAVLGKDFVDVKIDVERTVGGADLQKRYAGGKSGGIPWFAFVSAKDDHVIITSVDAEGRNAGFPVEDFEIAHFGAMLAKACRNATPAEIDALLASLKAVNKKPSSQ